MSEAVSTSIDERRETVMDGGASRGSRRSPCRKHEKRSRKNCSNVWRIPLPFFKGMGVPRRNLERGCIWTGVVVLTLTYGVHGITSDQLPPLVPRQVSDSVFLTLFRNIYEQELMKQILRQQLQLPPEPEQQQVPESLEMPEEVARYEPVPLPLALHVGDMSRETEKRASSSSELTLCRYKICSPGRKKKLQDY